MVSEDTAEYPAVRRQTVIRRMWRYLEINSSATYLFLSVPLEFLIPVSFSEGLSFGISLRLCKLFIEKECLSRNVGLGFLLGEEV